MKLKIVTNALNDFFFKPQSAYSVALLRIALGVIVLLTWFSMWKNLEVFWGVDGILSMQTSMKYGNSLRFNLFDYLPRTAGTPIFLALMLLLGAIGMILGLFTRISIGITFIVLLSFHSRNSFILNSSDIIVRNFLFLLFFSPSGDVLSLDRWIAKMRGLAQGDPVEKSPWALRLMQIQFSVIYIATVLYKMKGPLWADGTAVYFATRLDEFVKIPLDILNSLLVIKFLTWSTLAVELALGTLVWIKELRYWVLLAGIGLHLGIEVTMSIPLFEWIMIATMICMVDSRDIEAWLKKLRNYRTTLHPQTV
ncbi:HTTM domain-containing protein [Bdellovibrio bacteriovorus]|uniref:HTTM domain-containing protein n=1 Tax=Bdellovibrio bacteriovorus TaxID=959 RepID=UPI0035A97EBF